MERGPARARDEVPRRRGDREAEAKPGLRAPARQPEAFGLARSEGLSGKLVPAAPAFELRERRAHGTRRDEKGPRPRPSRPVRPPFQGAAGAGEASVPLAGSLPGAPAHG